jgi:hypothetical protein
MDHSTNKTIEGGYYLLVINQARISPFLHQVSNINFGLDDSINGSAKDTFILLAHYRFWNACISYCTSTPNDLP